MLIPMHLLVHMLVRVLVCFMNFPRMTGLFVREIDVPYDALRVRLRRKRNGLRSGLRETCAQNEGPEQNR